MATKYAYVGAFQLAMGDDPEADADTDRVAETRSTERDLYDSLRANADAYYAEVGPQLDSMGKTLRQDLSEVDSGDQGIVKDKYADLLRQWIMDNDARMRKICAPKAAGHVQRKIYNRLTKIAEMLGLDIDTMMVGELPEGF